MATPPNNSGVPNMDDAKETLINYQHEIHNATQEFKKLNKEQGTHLQEAALITSMSTKLNKVMQETLDISNKIGTQYVKKETVLSRIKTLEDSRTSTNITLNQLQSNYGKSMEDTKTNLEKINKELDFEKARLEYLSSLSAKDLKLAKLTKKDVDKLTDAILAKEILQEQLKKKMNSAEFAALELAKQQLGVIDDNLEVAKKLLDTVDAGNKKIRSAGLLDYLIAQVPVLGQITSNFKSMSFWAAVLSSSTLIIKTLVGMMFEMDNRITAMGNSLNISNSSAYALNDNFINIIKNTEPLAENLDKSVRSIANLAEAMSGLNAQFGTSAMFSQRTLDNQIELTKQLKLEGDEAASIQSYAFLQKKSAEDILKSIGKQNKGLFDTKGIIKDVSKLSADITSNYGNNVEALAKAVVLAKNMGMSLEQAKKSSESLLDFETSIGNELEAELLTGKAWNLEKARALALDGDSAGAMKEMLKNVGSYNDYLKQNVIVKQSMAKALGMERGEFEKSLKTQEVLKAMNVESEESLARTLQQLKDQGRQQEANNLENEIRNKQNGEFVLKNIEALSTQEKFEESMKTLKGLLVSSMPTIKAIVEGFTSLLQHTTLMKVVLGSIATIMTFFAAKSVVAAVANVASASAMTLGIAGAAALVTAGTAAALMNSVDKSPTTMGDGHIAPSGRISINTPEGGLIIPSKRDHIFATTDPNGLLNGGSNGSKGSSSDSGLGDKLDYIASLLKRGGNVYMDSQRVGTSQATGYSSFA